MAKNAARFCSLLFVALALGPSLAHLLELPNKIGLPREEYFAVQQIYRGWALLGILVFAELTATALLVMLPHVPPSRLLGAVLAYRAVYELLPLLLGLVLLVVFEVTHPRGLVRRRGSA